MSVVSELATHVDSDRQRHRLTLLDARRLRCHDCARTVLLPAAAAVSGPTSTSTSPPPLHSPERCETHPGQRRGACGPCRSEHIADEQRRRTHQPTADVAAGAAAARAALRRADATDQQETT